MRATLIDRAVAAYARYCKAPGAPYQQPASTSYYDENRREVVLENIHGELARYRVTPTGRIGQLVD